MTVSGPIATDKLGTTLVHEHVMVDFVGAAQVTPDRYDRDEVFRVVLPHLKRAKQAGCDTLVECTPAYLGRDPILLQRLSESSGVQILSNTGYYGASSGKYLPEHARTESAEQLAERWIEEWRGGIGDSGVRPGFIKIGVDNGPLSEINRKLVQAAVRTHLETGLSIACHTGDGLAALEELQILMASNVSPSAWIWVHAQNVRDVQIHQQVASRGGWVELDGIGPNSIERHLQLVQNLKQHGLLDRVLLSHDAGWYSVGEPGGGDFRTYTPLLERFLPALQKAGFSDQEVHLLTVQNPAEAFAIRVRKT